MRGAIARSSGKASGRGTPLFEHIFHDPGYSFRCLSHDFPSEVARWNYHPEHEIHLIRESSGHAFVGDHVGTFEPGNLTFVASNVPHNWVSWDLNGRTVVQRDLVIQFSPDLLDNASKVFPELSRAWQHANAFDRSWEFVGASARRGRELMEAVHASSGPLRLARFLELVNHIGTAPERVPLGSKNFVPLLDRHDSDRLHHAITRVLELLPGDVRMADLARESGMSATAFSRFFKTGAGHTFVAYVRKLKIAEACRMLSDTDRPVTEICFAVGYSNISNFNRSFLRERGITPTRYRKLAWQADEHSMQ